VPRSVTVWRPSWEPAEGGDLAYVFDPAARLSRDVRRVARDRLDDAIATLDQLGEGDASAAEASATEEGVHDVRKRCKEVRALARLVRAPLGDEFERFNATVRDAADVLAPIRDAQAVLATLDDLRAVGNAVEPDLERVRGIQAAAAEQATRAIHSGDARIDHARELLVDARKRVQRWQLPDGFEAIGPGLERSYRRGRRTLREAIERPTDEHVHEWRKSVKNLWYHTRLLAPSAPSALAPAITALDNLAEALGDDHDLAVLVERLAADPHRYGGGLHAINAIEIARSQQAVLRRPAFRLGATVYAEKPNAFVARIEAYWTSTVGEGPELTTGGITELAAAEKRQAKARRKAAARAVALVPPATSGDDDRNGDPADTRRAQLAN
jgi:CHAD domain-containing protein